MAFLFPRIYPILDAAIIPSTGRAEFLRRMGGELANAGVSLLEYRNKTGSEAEIVADAGILRAMMPAPNIKLILDDRVDLVEAVNFDGAHVDSGDLSPAEARKLLGPSKIVGTFGGSEALVPGILKEPADYFSIGTVCATKTKQTTKSPIGAAGVRRLRAEAGPDAVLVAVGGIRLENVREIREAGATLVAVAAAIFGAGNPAAEFRRWVSAVA
jgi:thiamine-phosphate pyrophosphorylase